MTRWTGSDRDHDYFESRADEHRPIGDREGNGYTPADGDAEAARIIRNMRLFTGPDDLLGREG